jgi:hypothetical protein
MDQSTAPSSDPKKAPSGDSASAASSQPRKVNRLAIGLNVVTQTLIFAAIIMMVNYVNFRHFKRWDFSRNQKYALAPLTKNLLTGLKKPVKAVVFFPSFQVIAQDVSALLREYEYASDKKLTVEVVDPYRNLLRAKELSEKYKFGSSDNIVILDYEGKSKFVNAMDMAEMDNSGSMFGQPPTVRAFKGEEALTSALLEITEEKQSKVYFLTGHGEPAPPDGNSPRSRALSTVRTSSSTPSTSTTLTAFPMTPRPSLWSAERATSPSVNSRSLGDYWTERNGRSSSQCPASSKTPKVAAWLAAFGVNLQQDVVVQNRDDAGFAAAGDDPGRHGHDRRGVNASRLEGSAQRRRRL